MGDWMEPSAAINAAAQKPHGQGEVCQGYSIATLPLLPGHIMSWPWPCICLSAVVGQQVRVDYQALDVPTCHLVRVDGERDVHDYCYFGLIQGYRCALQSALQA